MTVGIKDDGTVMGISFLSLSETPGLGMKAKDDDFMSQFSNKKVDFFKYTKSEAKADNEINAISSATACTTCTALFALKLSRLFAMTYSNLVLYCN